MKHAKEIIVWISKVFVIISLYYVQYAYSCCGNSAPPFACVCTILCPCRLALSFPRCAVADPRCCRHHLPELALLLELRAVCAPPEFRVKMM